jgi:uncharacterized membrane protein YozB (DUF420 family)
MIATEDLPTLNAVLNASATVLLTVGFICIKTGREKAHRASMVSAFAVSVIFLFFYLLHKWLVKGVHTPFTQEGFIQQFYYAMLASHIILAMLVPFLVIITMTYAIKDKREKHKAWARWTFPIWYYVSVTGVLVYCFLYVWFQ